MNIKLAVSAVCAVFFAGAAVAADQQPDREQVVGFGSGTGMGVGGGTGSVSSVANSFAAQIQSGGAGSQTFGGGFNQQQTGGSGPLSSSPGMPTGNGPILGRP